MASKTPGKNLQNSQKNGKFVSITEEKKEETPPPDTEKVYHTEDKKADLFDE